MRYSSCLAATTVASLLVAGSAVAETPSLSSDKLFAAAFAKPSRGQSPVAFGPVVQSAAFSGASDRSSADWPAALHLNSRGFDIDLSPHAAVDTGAWGRSAEAGATLSFAPAAEKSDPLGDLGVRSGKAFGDQGRWYMFAAVSGKAVGLNMTRTDGDWRGAGWSSDPSSALVGDGQLGVGWRKGAMQAAFGYVHREIKVQNAPRGADNDIGDSMAAFTLSFKPHK